MSDNFKILQYKEMDCLHESGLNWTFWKTRIIPYLTGARLWPYVSGTVAKPNDTEADKLMKWMEMDMQALSTVLMYISPNVKAGLDCSCSKAAWDGFLGPSYQSPRRSHRS